MAVGGFKKFLFGSFKANKISSKHIQMQEYSWNLVLDDLGCFFFVLSTTNTRVGIVKVHFFRPFLKLTKVCLFLYCQLWTLRTISENSSCPTNFLSKRPDLFGKPWRNHLVRFTTRWAPTSYKWDYSLHKWPCLLLFHRTYRSWMAES